MIDLIRSSDPVPAHRAGAEVPKTLSDLIEKALRKNPRERFRTAKEMRDALKSFQSNPDDQVAKEISKILSVPGADPAELESGLLYLARRFPESAAICEKLGQFYNGSQRFADAVMIFKRGIECHPRHAQLHFDLALAYKGLAQNNEFVSFMKKAVELDHNLERYAHVALLTVAHNPAADDLVKSELSKIRSREGMRSSELESQLRDLNERFPDSSIACQELGEFYNGCHRFADAVRVFKRGIESHPSHAQLHLELALAHKGLGENTAFVGFLKKAVELDHGLERFAKVLLLTAAEEPPGARQ
jgi:tetratricopeptide (TPR) repeat protein